MEFATSQSSPECEDERAQEKGPESHGLLGPNPYGSESRLYEIWNDASLAAEQEISQFERHMAQRRAANLQDFAKWLGDLVVGKFDIEAKWACHAMVWNEAGARMFIRSTGLRTEAWVEVASDKRLPATSVGDLRLRLIERQRFWKVEALKRLRDIETAMLQVQRHSQPTGSGALDSLPNRQAQEQQDSLQRYEASAAQSPSDPGSNTYRASGATEESSAFPSSSAVDCGQGESAQDMGGIPDSFEKLLSSEPIGFDASVEQYWQELVEAGQLPSELVAEMRRDKRVYDEEFVSLHVGFLERIADATWPKTLKLAKQFGLERFEFFSNALSRRFALVSDTENVVELLESYELVLRQFKDVIVAQVSEILRNLPPKRRANILSSLACKLGARVLMLVHIAKTNHLDGKPPFETDSQKQLRPEPVRGYDQGTPIPSDDSVIEHQHNHEAEPTQPEYAKHPRKGDPAILFGKSAINFVSAEQYLGITERRRQQLLKQGVLERAGKGRNRLITVRSLVAFLPPVEKTRSNPK